MKEHLIQEIVVYLKVVAVDNSVNKLRVFDWEGKPHDLPIPNSPTVHSFLADLLTLRSIGLKAKLVVDAK